MREAGERVDWERMTAVARARGVTLQLSAPLEYLRDNFAASVPAEMVRTLRVTYLRFWAQTRRLWKIPSRLFIKAARAIGNRVGWYRYWDD